MTLTNATLYLAGTRKVTEVGISLLSATMTVEEWEDNVVIIDHRFCSQQTTGQSLNLWSVAI